MNAQPDTAKAQVDQWLLLEPGDSAVHDAHGVVATLGSEAERDLTRSTAALHEPLAEVARHRGDDSEVARSLHALRRELDGLDPATLEEPPGLFARSLAMVPGVGSPSSRYFKRLASSQPRIMTHVEMLQAGRGVLSRDNITLQADQDRVRERLVTVESDIASAQVLADALEFAIDVELPFGDVRRPLFEDDLLPTTRQRHAELDRTIASAREGIAAVDSVMANNRELVRGIDRVCSLTHAVLSGAVASGAQREVSSLTVTFNEIDAALNEIEARRRATLPGVSDDLDAAATLIHQEMK